MRILSFPVHMLLIGILAFVSEVAAGQGYPNKPVRIVCAGIGGGGDFLSRLIAPGLTAGLGQQVIVDNRASAVMGETVYKALPDGYTTLVTGSSLWVGSLLRDTPYDTVRDFIPISMLGRSPLLLVVHPSLPVNSVKDLIAYAKANPGALSFSMGGSGGTSHLAAELFKHMTGINMVRIPYKSGATEIGDLISGQVQLTFSTGAAAPHARSGKLRPLAVTGSQPSPLYPGVPTVAASGVPGYQTIAFDAMFAPARTPAAIIRRLNEEVVRVMNAPQVKERLLNNGAEAYTSSPEEAAATIKSEIALWSKLIKDAGIKAD